MILLKGMEMKPTCIVFFFFAIGYVNVRGRAIRDSDVPREEIFVVSKISRDANFGTGKTRRLVLKTLEKMGLDYFDMYKIHGPIGDR